LEASIADLNIFKSRRPENSSWKLGSGVSLSQSKHTKETEGKAHLNIYYKYIFTKYIYKNFRKTA
jgi:hypothetical protein